MSALAEVAAAGLGLTSACLGADSAESLVRRGVRSRGTVSAMSAAVASEADWSVFGEDCDAVESAVRGVRAEWAARPRVGAAVSAAAEEPAAESGADGPEVSEEAGSAQATAGPVKIAAPTPNAAARAPMRPTYVDALIFSSLSVGRLGCYPG